MAPTFDSEHLDDFLDLWDGLFVGQLTPNEEELLVRACAEGKARYSYEGVAGLLGLAKVRKVRQIH